MSFLQKLKSFFGAPTKMCPSCNTDLSSEARRCPECNHNFLEKAQSPFRVMSLGSNWCCTAPLLLLLLIVWLAFKSEAVQTVLLSVLVVLLVILIAVIFYFGQWIWRVKKMFRF